MEKISISFIASYSFYPTVESIIISMFGFFKILSMIFMFGFFFLEFIIDFDVEKYQKEKLDKEEYIIKNKLQWWRLRNCNWFFRILIYTIIFIFCFLMLLNSFLLSGNDRPDFVAFGTFLKQFLAVYVVVFMFFDYRFVQRARKKVLQIPKFEVGEKV
jgi:type III secretory pathway component EscU